jgi:hypothetical protein
MEGRICETHAGVRGFPADLARTSGFPAETGSGSFGVGANGSVIGVGFGDSGLCLKVCGFPGYLARKSGFLAGSGRNRLWVVWGWS